MIPVVVINSSLNALGVVRSLTCGRMPIYLVTTTRRCPAAWSRYCRIERLRSFGARELVDGLKALSRRIGQRPVLILTSDAEVETISAFREELAPFFRLNLPSKDIVRTLADKTLFQELAEREGFPVPRAVIVCGPTDLSKIESLTLPVVIKPGDKKLVMDGQVERAVLADKAEGAQAAARRMLKHAQGLIVQEWIDGTDADIYFTLFACDPDSRPSAMFSGRKLVCDPPNVGTTAVCVAAPQEAEELEGMCRQFISRVGYRGIGSLEFKRDSKDGRFVIIEPTVGRTDWQEEIATLCGINIPLIAYCIEIGQAAPNSPRAPAQAAWRSSREHRLQVAAMAPGTRIFDGYFRLGDPLPGLYHYAIDRFVLRAYRLAMRLLSRSNKP